MTSLINVLFVDDQKTLLNAVKRVVRRKAENWNVYFADSAEAAIETLQENMINVVVTDMRMPGKDGVQLLEWVRENKPNTIRFILSGYSNFERNLESVKVAHQYFIKPFATQEIIVALELTHSLYKRIRNPGLQGIIASIDRLPTPRRVFYQINEALQNPEVSIEKIASLVASDTAIAGKILQVTNSAFFGQKKNTADILQSVSVLGIERIKSLVLIAGIASDHKEILNGLISINLYSKHCLEVAHFSSMIGKQLGYSMDEQNTLFTAGLLHDVGKLVMIKKYIELYTTNEWEEDPYSTKIHVDQIEQLYSDHAAIGASLIALWGLPVSTVNAVAYYQEPQECDDSRNFAAILHIADAMSRFLQSGQDPEMFDSAFCNMAALKKMDIDYQAPDHLELFEQLRDSISPMN